ncbi:LTA synthase family protein [Pseudomonas sp. 6D_7.1_Bac1]|uniref:LTA synthase family protein n=1 Tax=Pseudomonas sp. 6D_7.1_Bac1 TaxID=2971615 RepID=UPI0021C6452B|nr:LTA synthase family protein [Pseudomonas sp. 6D_7.1_Bac1]MCU1750284.1 LTA synthase family protein [Pseudomonas sp. 6D_7.1_Bac1]
MIAAGVILTYAIEAMLIPRPSLRRPLRSWLLHAGVWLFLVAALYTLTGRPVFSALNVLALWLLIVLVSNAKYHSLREPFVCADFEYFSDAIRYPRLYLPFFGIGKAIALTLAFMTYLACGLYFEPATAHAIPLGMMLLMGATGLLALGSWKPLRPTFDAHEDLSRWGLAASLWTYFLSARRKVNIDELNSPFAAHTNDCSEQLPDVLPDLISVQSESFFDVRRLWPGIRQQVLTHYDHLCSEAQVHGRLQVAAWGANTVRTEFAFLTGIAGDKLGVHRFNPYRHLARQGLPSIAAHMKSKGYRTVCIHPYSGSFYGRNRVLPMLGFDVFIDIRSFNDSQKSGPFIGDLSVGEKIIELLTDNARHQPLYIHAVTMENHGPLHLEQVPDDQWPVWFDRPALDGLRDLAAYVRHLSNADQMLGQLRKQLLATSTPAGLCFFGDHVPILPEVYIALGEPNGDTDYFIWSNTARTSCLPTPMAVEQLASHFVDQFK